MGLKPIVQRKLVENRTLVSDDIIDKPAILVGVQQGHDADKVAEDLEELEALLVTLGIKTADRIIQKRGRLSASHLLGAGKIEEVHESALKFDARLVVIDHSLNGIQTRNLEKGLGCQVLDRAGIILDIFSKHAKTSQAKTQVEIAQLEYLLPRLTGAWTHFQRQKGGGVRARGMGEKQIEVDRRRARERIAKLNRRLQQIEKEKTVQRKSRKNQIKVALVGYTNTGKTTVMKGLTRSLTQGKNELFATLDASIRQLDPNTRPKILLSDTVGFIKSLPHGLVESFKSTLEEVKSADLLLHVVDVAHPNYQGQIETTNAVLEEIGAGGIPTVLVFNKMDQVEEKFLPRILEKKYQGSIAISAYKDEDIGKLRSHVFDYFQDKFQQVQLKVKSDDQEALSLVYQNCIILDANYEQLGFVEFKLRAPESILAKIKRLSGCNDMIEEF